MKTKKIIKALKKRIEQLEGFVKPEGITFQDPLDQNKSVFVGIQDGRFTQNVITKIPSTTETTNITNQSI